MTERKWTPGPWRAVRNIAFWEIRPERSTGDAHIHYIVGDVCASDPDDTNGLQEYNAHLIAAAPDLYEALEGIVCGDGVDDYSKAMAALAKARGEQ